MLEMTHLKNYLMLEMLGEFELKFLKTEILLILLSFLIVVIRIYIQIIIMMILQYLPIMEIKKILIRMLLILKKEEIKILNIYLI